MQSTRRQGRKSKRDQLEDTSDEDHDSTEDERRKRASKRRKSPGTDQKLGTSVVGIKDGIETDDNDDFGAMQFSQQIPEVSQINLHAKPAEEKKFDGLDEATKEKIVKNLSRIFLFKALSGDPIDRTKTMKEALEDYSSEATGRMGNAVFLKAADRIKDVFGYELKPIPKYLEKDKNLPAKYKDRYYAINEVPDDAAGSHSKAIHSVHHDSAIEKGLLMLVLAFAYCKGDLQNGSRWITDEALYKLLHSVDTNIPLDPPKTSSKRANNSNASPFVSRSRNRRDSSNGVADTPDVDSLLEKFVHMDYLMKKKNDMKLGENITSIQEEEIIYAMGPRAALEIGRRQVIYFCAEILDEQPDPTMLQEIEGEEPLEEENN